MLENYTDLTVVQDRSSSMSCVRSETIQGFNAFLEEQKKMPGKCTISLTQFHTEFNQVWNGIDIQRAVPLTSETYVTEGSTALLDAIGNTIDAVGARLAAMPEAERPARVVFVITTDGEENSSERYRGKEGHMQVMKMIKHQTDVFKWQFIFLGASQDGIQAGDRLGVTASNSISTANNAKGVKMSYAATSSNIRNYRSARPDEVETLKFSADQRTEQYSAGAVQDNMTNKSDSSTLHSQ